MTYEYITLKQVRDKLDSSRKEGRLLVFSEAIHELMQSNAHIHDAPPENISFNQWNIRDSEQFLDIFLKMTVNGSSILEDPHIYSNTRQWLHSAKHAYTGRSISVFVPFTDQPEVLQDMKLFTVYYALYGDSKIVINGALTEMKQGDCIIVAPHVLHFARMKNDSSVLLGINLWETSFEQIFYTVLRHESMLSDFFKSCLVEGRQGWLTFNMPTNDKVLEVIKNILYYHFSPEKYSEEICLNYMNIFMTFLLRDCHVSSTLLSSGAENGERATLPAILEYINDNYLTVSLNKLAGLCHYEASYLGKLIKAATGKNFTTLVSELRVNKAKQLLSSTDMTINEIADASGFHSFAHFSRAFHKLEGRTASEYRHAARYSS